MWHPESWVCCSLASYRPCLAGRLHHCLRCLRCLTPTGTYKSASCCPCGGSKSGELKVNEPSALKTITTNQNHTHSTSCQWTLQTNDKNVSTWVLVIHCPNLIGLGARPSNRMRKSLTNHLFLESRSKISPNLKSFAN